MTQNTRDLIVAALAKAGTDTAWGVTSKELSADLPDIPIRTVQYHLRALAAAGLVDVAKDGRALRYKRTATTTDKFEADRPLERATRSWLSPEGAEVERLVSRPLEERPVVGYQRALLGSYRPNVDRLIDEETCVRLAALGRAPGVADDIGTYARQILTRLLIDLSWASSHLEGNTYSHLDTENLIAFGRYASGKDELEAAMILNHKAAIEMLVENVDEIGFNRFTIQSLHALLAEDLLPDAGAAGRLRSTLVGITSSTYQPTGIPHVIEECFDEILRKADAVQDPFEQALFLMVHLPYLQPFEDVNKRVSRLAANIPFIKNNLAPLTFVGVPRADYIRALLGVYEFNRIELLRDLFAHAYERSCQRYTTVRDALPRPNPLRMRYREELHEVVANIVREDQPVDETNLRTYLTPAADADHLDELVSIAINELHHLHIGNIARFRLRPSEFSAWTNRPQQKR